ncbi:MAG: SDR family oxidoreductase [Proteobacteria bacterium]|nr:SDR family oxidoreductase [Pseudomonadota bacterium]
MPRVLITGATGMIGRALCGRLQQDGYILRAALRTEKPLPQGVLEAALVGDIAHCPDWDAALARVDFVIHAAARTHVFESAPDEERIRKVNVEGSARLATAAVRAGVRRFIYLSSIKVNGEDSGAGTFTADAPPHPQDAYGRSKLEAEQAVRRAVAGSGTELAIVRPPLVYGPHVQANFLRLMRWVDRGMPLPLGAIHNRRSLLSVWNLADLIACLLSHPAAAGRVWLAADAEDLSTPDLIRRIAASLGRRPRLLPVPPALLRLGAALTGQTGQLARLCGSLTVDTSPARTLLGWTPPLAVDQGLARTAAWYRILEPA